MIHQFRLRSFGFVCGWGVVLEILAALPRECLIQDPSDFKTRTHEFHIIEITTLYICSIAPSFRLFYFFHSMQHCHHIYSWLATNLPPSIQIFYHSALGLSNHPSLRVHNLGDLRSRPLLIAAVQCGDLQKGSARLASRPIAAFGPVYLHSPQSCIAQASEASSFHRTS